MIGARSRLLASALLACSLVVGAAEKAPRPEGTPKGVEFVGGDGNGCESAVVIRGSKDAREIVMSEIAWLRARYPGYKFRDNKVETKGARSFEEIVIDTATGEKKAVCFDVTDGFKNDKLGK